jgi:hypothetical protein
MNLTAFSATGSYEHWPIISSTATVTTPIRTSRRRQCWACGRRRHPPPRLDQFRVSCRLRCCDRRARQQRQKFPASIPRPACATIFSLAYVIGRGARLIPAQCRLRAGSGRSKRHGNRETSNSILRPTGSTISKRVWRTRRRWSHASSRCCGSSISSRMSTFSDYAAVSIRSSNRKLHSTSSSASPTRRSLPICCSECRSAPYFEEDGIARNAWVQSVLDRIGLTGDLVEVGAQLARIMVELLAGLRAEREFFSDATTVLDSETEAAIFQRLKDEFVGRSLFCQPTPYPASPTVSTES